MRKLPGLVIAVITGLNLTSVEFCAEALEMGALITATE